MADVADPAAAARVDADAPLPDAAAAAPAVESAAVAAEVAPPVEAPAPEAAAAAAEPAAAPKTVGETPSLLEEVADKPGIEKAAADNKPAEEKPAESAAEPEKKADEKPADASKEGEKAEEAPAEPQVPAIDPINYAEHYTLPERIQMDDAVRGEFHGVLDDFRRDPKASTQKLLDLHATQMERYAEALGQEQHRMFLDTRAQWRDLIQKDEQLGGTNWDGVRQNVAQARNQFVSDAEPGSDRYVREWREFDEFTRITGAGDHPVLFRLLNNVAKMMGEPLAPSVSEIKPAPNGRQPGSKRALMYDHPSSPNNRN